MKHMAAYKCPECVPMELYATEMLFVNTRAQIDTSENLNFIFSNFLTLLSTDANAKWDGLVMDYSVRWIKTLMDGLIEISGVQIRAVVLIIVPTFRTAGKKMLIETAWEMLAIPMQTMMEY
jgi:hypothetical protein